MAHHSGYTKPFHGSFLTSVVYYLVNHLYYQTVKIGQCPEVLVTCLRKYIGKLTKNIGTKSWQVRVFMLIVMILAPSAFTGDPLTLETVNRANGQLVDTGIYLYITLTASHRSGPKQYEAKVFLRSGLNTYAAENYVQCLFREAKYKPPLA
uniref:Uncharacterized protein n=1 Tax=Cannabis sativa TaxID=3483 RepID=A0A803QRS6_CANSA